MSEEEDLNNTDEDSDNNNEEKSAEDSYEFYDPTYHIHINEDGERVSKYGNVVELTDEDLEDLALFEEIMREPGRGLSEEEIQGSVNNYEQVLRNRRDPESNYNSSESESDTDQSSNESSSEGSSSLSSFISFVPKTIDFKESKSILGALGVTSPVFDSIMTCEGQVGVGVGVGSGDGVGVDVNIEKFGQDYDGNWYSLAEEMSGQLHKTIYVPSKDKFHTVICTNVGGREHYLGRGTPPRQIMVGYPGWYESISEQEGTHLEGSLISNVTYMVRCKTDDKGLPFSNIVHINSDSVNIDNMNWVDGWIAGVSDDPTKPLIFGEKNTNCKKTKEPAPSFRFNSGVDIEELNYSTIRCEHLERVRAELSKRYPHLYVKVKVVGQGPVTNDLYDHRINVKGVEVRSTIGESNEQLRRRLYKWTDVIAYPDIKSFIQNDKLYIGPMNLRIRDRLSQGQIENIEIVNPESNIPVIVDWNSHIKARIYINSMVGSISLPHGLYTVDFSRMFD